MTKWFATASITLGGFVLSITLLMQVPALWWTAVWDSVAPRWPTLVLIGIGLAAVIAGAVALRKARPKREVSAAPLPRPLRPLRPIPAWTIPAGAVLVAVVTWIAVWWLQVSVPAGGGAVEQVKLRVEAIRTGLSVGAGVAVSLATSNPPLRTGTPTPPTGAR